MTKHSIPIVDQFAAEQFLRGHRFALIGASDDPKNFSGAINRELTAHGYDIVPVNPSSALVWERDCYRTVFDVPGVLDGAIIMVPPEAAPSVVQQCVDNHIDNIWLFRGIGGPGATSSEATDICQARGVNLVDGACPLMFVEHSGWMHRLHHAIRVARGSVEDTRALR